MNILILAAGTRNKIVQYFKKTLGNHGKVIATDASKYGPAIYDADKYYLVPAITDRNYIDTILDICKKEEIKGVLSLIDPELALLAKNEEKFSAIGTTVVGSSYELCEKSYDKLKMYEWMICHGFNCARSWREKRTFYNDINTFGIKYPVIVKPSTGSASIDVSKCYDKETLENLISHTEGLMIQELLDGEEIGADVYVDMISGKVVSIFTKKKLRMRAGETDKAVSFRNQELFQLISDFVEEAGFRGPIDIDIFSVKGRYYFNEVNPRFGGGYPHAYECGCNFMEMIVNNLMGVKNKPSIGDYQENVYMLKYSDIKIIQGLTKNE